MTRLYYGLMMLWLAACDFNVLQPLPVVGDATGSVDLASGEVVATTFVARWQSTKGKQSVFASSTGGFVGRTILRTLTLTLPDGRVLSGTDSKGGDIPLQEHVSCRQNHCAMEAIGRITLEDKQGMDGTVEGSVAWGVVFSVTPESARVEVSDLVIEVLDQDAGAP